MGACGEATGESDCQDTESAQCAWFPNSHVVLDNDLTTCEAGAVYYREAGLEVGAVELLVFNDESLCDFPVDFAPCQVNSNPKPGSEPSFFPPECACACE